MVELGEGRPDGSGVPTIAELLNAHRDRTGASYREMARKVGDEINQARFQQLATKPPGRFPEARTVELLSQVLALPVTTIVLAFAAGLGLDVKPGSGLLSQALPPGADDLPGEDRDAVVAVARALVRARAEGPPPITSPEPATKHDYTLAARRGDSEGRRLRRQQDTDAESQ